MSSQVSHLVNFSTPADLAQFLQREEQFQLPNAQYAKFTTELLGECGGFAEITHLFDNALRNAEGCLCHKTIQQLRTQYHASLATIAKTSQPFLEESTHVINGWKHVMRALDESDDCSSAKEPIDQAKRSADKATSLFATIIQQAALVDATAAITRAVTDEHPSRDFLQLIKKCQDNGATPDPTIVEARAQALNKIATLDQTIQALTKISTIFNHSRIFWSNLHTNAHSVASRCSEMELSRLGNRSEELRAAAHDATQQWLGIARIHQLVCQQIQPVLAELGTHIKSA